LKSALDQRLRLRGSREFATRELYAAFLDTCVTARNAGRQERVEQERAQLRALPLRPLPAYKEFYATVSRASAVRIINRSYSVSSRLIGCRLRVRAHADMLELDYQGATVAVMERLIGAERNRIDYRHIIHTLVRKPGAFRRYVFREALFPSLEFRRAYDALLAQNNAQADLEYLRILQLAAGDGEATVREALSQLLTSKNVPTYEAVRALVRAPRTPGGVPYLHFSAPDLAVYDRLLGASTTAVCA
jgi:hypothetical protein